MQNMVIFRDNQELDSADLNNIQTYARATFDGLVGDMVADGSYYAGFGLSQAAATQVTIAPGNLYVAGASYNSPSPVTIDLFSQLPVVTQKWVALVANGNDVQTNVQPRDFLTDATTGATQPQSVAMEDSRVVVLNTIAGAEAPQPSYPTTTSTVVVIGYVLLTTTGISQIVQFTDTQMPNLAETDAAVAALDAWQVQVNGTVGGLTTGLAGLRAALAGYATSLAVLNLTTMLNNLANQVAGIAAQVAGLAIKVSQPAAYIFYGRNYFLDSGGSDVTNGAFTAVINEGVRFPAGGATSTAALALLNPLDPNAAVNSGYMIPAYTSKLRVACQGYANELQISTLSYQSARGCTLLTRRRRRHRCGGPFLPGGSSDWWNIGNFDPVASTLAFAAESFGALSVANYIETVNPSDPQSVSGLYDGARRNLFWEDYYSQPYWNRVTSTVNVSGQQFAQTFLNAQDGWLTQIGLFFTRIANTGDVDVKICQVDASNRPDLTNVVSSFSIPAGNLKAGSLSSGLGLPTLVETVVPIPPTFLSGGVRYAIVATTAGQHYMAMSTSDFGVLQGNYFYCDSTQTFILDTTRVLRMKLYYASFAATQVAIQLASLSLSGGISAIDILSEAEVPSACSLTFQVQLGGVWYPLNVSGVGPNLSSAPTLLPLQAVFTGTTDLMPGLGLTKSAATVSPPAATSCEYLSLTETLGSASQNLKISVVLENWNPSDHTCTIKLNSGGSHSATSVVDVTQPDGSVLRSATFTLGSTISSYVVEIDMATSVAGNTFYIAELDQYAV